MLLAVTAAGRLRGSGRESARTQETEPGTQVTGKSARFGRQPRTFLSRPPGIGGVVGSICVGPKELRISIRGSVVAGGSPLLVGLLG